MLTELKEALKNALDFDEQDLEGLSTSEIVDLAETYSSLPFNPDAILDEAGKIPGNEDGHASEKAIQLFAKGAAELDAYIYQFEVGRVLADAYEHGDQTLHLSPDKRKREKYGRFSPNSTTQTTVPAEEPLSWSEKIKLAVFNVLNTLGISTTEDLRNKLTWYTRLRLLAGVRLNRILAISNHGFLNKIGIIAGIASLSYFVELFVNVVNSLRAAFFPTIEEAIKTPRMWDRFINKFCKDYRLLDMCNALWGVVNLIGLFASAGVTAAFNLGFFHRDFFEDAYKLYHDQKKYNLLLDRILKKEKCHQAEMDRLNQLKETPAILAQKENLMIKMARLERTKERLLEAKKSNRNLRLWLLTTTTLILVGMIIILVPQIAAVAVLAGLTAKMTGSYLALSGSVFNRALVMKVKEIGSRLMETIANLFNRKKTPAPAKTIVTPSFNAEMYQEIKQLQVDYLLNKACPDSGQVSEMAQFGRQKASFFQAPTPALRRVKSMKHLAEVVKRPVLGKANSDPIPIQRPAKYKYPTAMIRDGLFTPVPPTPMNKTDSLTSFSSSSIYSPTS